jgi:anti-anti-sigma factor
MRDLLDSWSENADHELPVSHTYEFETLVLRPRGDIDSHNAGLLPSIVLGSQVTGSTVIVDLGAVAFVDSAGVRALLLCETRLAQQDVYFHVRNPQPNVRRMLELTNTAYLLVTGPASV